MEVENEMSSKKLLEKAKLLKDARTICLILHSRRAADELSPLIGMLEGAARIAAEMEIETPADQDRQQ